MNNDRPSAIELEDARARFAQWLRRHIFKNGITPYTIAKLPGWPPKHPAAMLYQVLTASRPLRADAWRALLAATRRYIPEAQLEEGQRLFELASRRGYAKNNKFRRRGTPLLRREVADALRGVLIAPDLRKAVLQLLNDWGL